MEKGVRRCTQRFNSISCFAVCILCLAFACTLLNHWSLSRHACNKLQHILLGNGAPIAKGYGKAKGKSKGSDSVLQPDLLPSRVWEAMPQAAQQRLFPSPIQEEWNVPVKLATQLTSTGGVAFCYRDFIPDVLRNVGYTHNPCAILIVQPPNEVGLRGYPYDAITCQMQTLDADNNQKITLVDRHLVQIGFGDPVLQVASGDVVQFPSCMIRLVVKASPHLGWLPEMVSANMVAKFLDKIVPPGSYADILSRTDTSATCRVHCDHVDSLLRHSGQQGIFVKIHKSETFRPEMELLWLAEDTSHTEALQAATVEGAFGLAVKTFPGPPRFAVRFQASDKLQAAAGKLGVPDLSNLGRWKLVGVPESAGPVGALAVLLSKGWEVQEVLYCTPKACVFVPHSRCPR